MRILLSVTVLVVLARLKNDFLHGALTEEVYMSQHWVIRFRGNLRVCWLM